MGEGVEDAGYLHGPTDDAAGIGDDHPRAGAGGLGPDTDEDVMRVVRRVLPVVEFHFE
jgi:hypothetical protein